MVNKNGKLLALSEGFPHTMTKHTLSAHSALTAIAAGLALASTPALAQTTDPAPADAASAPIVVPSAQPAPAAPGPVTSIALPQIAPAPPAATPAAPATASAPLLPEVAAQRSVRAEPAPVRHAAPADSRTAQNEVRATPVTRPAPATPVAPKVAPAPAQPPVTARGADAALPSVPLIDPATLKQDARPAPLPVQNANEPSGEQAVWVVGGAGAALLIGLGALVFLRRRSRSQTRHDDTPIVAPVVAREPEPLFATPGFSITPPAPVSPAAAPAGVAMPADEPAVAELAEASPVPATSPASSAAVLTRGEHSEELEAMVAQAPTPDNPFLTRGKRLRRAEFILQHGQAPQSGGDVPSQVQPEPTATPAKEKGRAPVYNFANGPVSFRPQGWKPATT